MFNPHQDIDNPAVRYNITIMGTSHLVHPNTVRLELECEMITDGLTLDGAAKLARDYGVVVKCTDNLNRIVVVVDDMGRLHWSVST